MASTEADRAVLEGMEAQPWSGKGNATTIPFVERGKAGQQLIFLHANGYPPDCYTLLFDQLTSRFRFKAMIQRPLWEGSPPDPIENWQVFSDDLRQFLREQGGPPATVVGHSLGAIAALRAAIADPRGFERLILLDPVLLDRPRMLAWRMLRGLGFGHGLHGLIRRTLKRRRTFNTLPQAFGAYRQRDIFRLLSDEALKAMIAGLFRPRPGGDYELVYSPASEARIYQAAIWNDADLWEGLPGLAVPTLIIRGARSQTLTSAVCRRAAAANPRITIRTVERASHLLPLERPREVAGLIKEFIAVGRPPGQRP